jgi:hypothetical protein
MIKDIKPAKEIVAEIWNDFLSIANNPIKI